MSETPTDTPTDRRTETDVDTVNTDTMKWLSALVALIGLYIAVSPFILESTDTAMWNDLIVGAAIFLLAAYNFYRLSGDQLANVGVATLVVLLGLWALISPAVIEMGSDELATGTAVSGLAVAVLSGYNAYANNKADVPERLRTRA